MRTTCRPTSVEALCERADKALYQAKALGRNRVESAVDELVPLVPEAPVESDVTPADLTISRPKQARRDESGRQPDRVRVAPKPRDLCLKP